MSAGLVAGGLGLAVTLANLASVGVAAWRLRPPRALLPPPEPAPEVTIVRPVCGLETFSEETLRSGFRLSPPPRELIFCVADDDDPVIPLVERLRAENPQVPSRLIVGDEPVSANPKLNNCTRGWDAAQTEWVVLADSNVLMPPDYLARLCAAWRPDSGLVCSTPVGSRPANWAARVECAFLNTLQARWQYVGECLGLGFAQGKSMLWRKPLLEPHGGLRALAAEIAEDAAATKLVRRAGLHVHLVDAPFEQPLGPRALREVVARQFRWARLRRVTFPLFFAPEILIGAVIPSLAMGWGAVALGHGAPGFALATLFGLALAYGAELLLARRMGWFGGLPLLGAMAARDLLFPGIWAAAFLSGEVVWRGNLMRIEPGRGGEPAPAAPSPGGPAR